ncbi:MAG: inversin-B-like [Gammaproteobacteria bacterium]|jgi:ankyrin repeat protein|nr:inversin-B-like [Gammaproteobacteria bacterium]
MHAIIALAYAKIETDLTPLGEAARAMFKEASLLEAKLQQQIGQEDNIFKLHLKIFVASQAILWQRPDLIRILKSHTWLELDKLAYPWVLIGLLLFPLLLLIFCVIPISSILIPILCNVFLLPMPLLITWQLLSFSSYGSRAFLSSLSKLAQVASDLEKNPVNQPKVEEQGDEAKLEIKDEADIFEEEHTTENVMGCLTLPKAATSLWLPSHRRSPLAVVPGEEEKVELPRENNLSLFKLPRELLAYVYSYLSLVQISKMREVSKVIKALSDLAITFLTQQPLFWKNKFQQHFPYLYPIVSSRKEAQWQKEFWNAYKSEYQNNGHLFLMVKDGETPEISQSVSQARDMNKRDFFYWYRVVRCLTIPPWWLKKEKEEVWSQKSISLAIHEGYFNIADFFLKTKVDKLHSATLEALLGAEEEAYQYPNIVEALKKSEEIIIRGDNRIHIAAKKGCLEAVKLLIAADRSLVEKPNAQQETPLICAARFNSQNIVAFLIKEGTLVTASTQDAESASHGRTALHWAAIVDNVVILNLLLEKGASLRVPDGTSAHQLPIHLAAATNSVNTLSRMIEAEVATLDQADAEGRTPLMLAVANGQMAAVKLLINYFNQYERSPSEVINCPSTQDHQKHLIQLVLDRGYEKIALFLGEHFKNKMRLMPQTLLTRQLRSEILWRLAQ